MVAVYECTFVNNAPKQTQPREKASHLKSWNVSELYFILNSIHFAWNLFGDGQAAKWTGASLPCICIIILLGMLLACFCMFACSDLCLWSFKPNNALCGLSLKVNLTSGTCIVEVNNSLLGLSQSAKLVWHCICHVLSVFSLPRKKEACRVFYFLLNWTLLKGSRMWCKSWFILYCVSWSNLFVTSKF